MDFRYLVPLAVALVSAGHLLMRVRKISSRWLRVAIFTATIALVLSWVSTAELRRLFDSNSVFVVLSCTLVGSWLVWYRPWTAALVCTGGLILALLVVASGNPPAPSYGWGAIYLPPFLAGLVLGTTSRRRYLLQLALILGWLLCFYFVGTQLLMSRLDLLLWRQSYVQAANSGVQVERVAGIVRAAQQEMVVIVAAYLLIELVTLGLCWLPVMALLASHRAGVRSPVAVLTSSFERKS